MQSSADNTKFAEPDLGSTPETMISDDATSVYRYWASKRLTILLCLPTPCCTGDKVPSRRLHCVYFRPLNNSKVRPIPFNMHQCAAKSQCCKHNDESLELAIPLAALPRHFLFTLAPSPGPPTFNAMLLKPTSPRCCLCKIAHRT